MNSQWIEEGPTQPCGPRSKSMSETLDAAKVKVTVHSIFRHVARFFLLKMEVPGKT